MKTLEAFSQSNPVAETYLAMLGEEDKKRYPFKKEEDKPQDDDDADEEDVVDDNDETEEDGGDSKKPDDDNDEDDGYGPDAGEDDEEGEPQNPNAPQNPVTGQAPMAINQRPDWVPETVSDEDLSAFIDAVSDALSNGKNQFQWGGRFFLIQRKPETGANVDLNPTLDPNANLDQDPNSSKNRQKNFGESSLANVASAVAKILQESSIEEAVETGNPGRGYHGQNPKGYSAMHAKVKKLGFETGYLTNHKTPNKAVRHYLDSVRGRHLAGRENDHEFIKKDFSGFMKRYDPSLHESLNTDGDPQTRKILDLHKKIEKIVERPDENKQDGTEKVEKAKEPAAPKN